jgi:hypothetical protein
MASKIAFNESSMLEKMMTCGKFNISPVELVGQALYNRPCNPPCKTPISIMHRSYNAQQQNIPIGLGES